MKYDILAIGTLYVDIISTNFPFDEQGLKPESDTLGDDYIVALGGSVPNFAKVLSSLGLKTLVIGKCGKDYMAELFSEMAADANIATDLIVDNSVQTSVSINFVNSKGHTIITGAGNGNDSLKSDEILKKFSSNIQDTKYFYIGSFLKIKQYKEIVLQIIDIAHKNKVRIIVDHGRIHNRIEPKDFELLNTVFNKLTKSDFYFPNRHELLKVSNSSSEEQAIKTLQSAYRMRVVAKLDKDGSIACEDNDIIKAPAIDVKPINTIGAGDSFNAGFIKATELGMGLEEALRFANATAALKISHKELPTYEEVSSLLGHLD